MKCLCGCPENVHCPEHGCSLCACFKYRPRSSSVEQEYNRLVAEKLALLVLPIPKGRIQ